jgi:P-type Ca2+ transporter type 2C
LVQALHARNEIVAMTGDGINDAPALREADIGVAMGKHGTEVAREAATIVLLDDNFTTIVAAIGNGRRIVDNLRRAFGYLIAFHPPLLLAALIVPLSGRPLLLLPVHLVLLELVVHPVVSLVFENDPPDADLMARPPRRPGQGLLGGVLVRPLLLGLTLSVAVIAVYLGALGDDVAEDRARALAFATLLIGQALLILAARAVGPTVWSQPRNTNPTLLPAFAGVIAVTVGAVHVPPAAHILKLQPLGLVDWVIAAAVAIAATCWPVPRHRRPAAP